MCVLSMICVVLNVSVSVSNGGVSVSAPNVMAGSVAILESNKLCSLSMWDVFARMFSVSGSVKVAEMVGSGSSVFSNVEVTVMYRVFLSVPTLRKSKEQS